MGGGIAPIVSVIVPAYNAEKTIGQCLKALTGQSYPTNLYEVIVVDDGSTDGTCNIVKDYAVRYVRYENSGPATARNKGVQETRGKIVLFTDSDCVPDANWVDEMIKPFGDPKVMAVKGAYRTKQQSIIARFSQIEFEERFELLKKVESIDMVDTYSAGYRKEIFLQMGGFDTSFPVANNEDTELSYRMSNLGFKMVFNPNAIVYHLNHPSSIRRYARLKFWRGYWRVIVYKRFPNKMVKDTYTPQTLKFQIIFFFLSILGLVGSIISLMGFYLLFLGLISFCIISFPFIKFAIKRERAIGLLSPFFLFLRAGFIGLGALIGAISLRR